MQGYGDAISDIKNVKYGATITAPAAPTATGYTFGGWYKDADCTNEWDFATDTVTGATTLYAKWIANAYSITVAETENGSISVSDKNAFTGQTVTITITPDKGYTLETLTVKDAWGKEITLTAKEVGNTYTFIMSGSNVSIEASFMEDNTMLNYFVDVFASDYYYDAVLWAAENDITNGVDATHFAPLNITTRAQMVTFLWRASGSPEPIATECAFTDVVAGSYYEKAVLWGIENGHVKGTSPTTFSPDVNVTRGQAVAFLARLSGVMDEDSGYTLSFTDVAVTEYYYNAIAWASENGITSGTSETTFSPDDDCLRGQVVTFLYRYFVK